MTLPNKAVEKQPYEEFYIAGSILRVQTATETINLTNSSVEAEDKNGDDVTASFTDDTTKVLGTDPKGSYADNTLEIRIRGGDPALSPYKVTFKMETTEGNKWEVDREVEVEEK